MHLLLAVVLLLIGAQQVPKKPEPSPKSKEPTAGSRIEIEPFSFLPFIWKPVTPYPKAHDYCEDINRDGQLNNAPRALCLSKT